MDQPAETIQSQASPPPAEDSRRLAFGPESLWYLDRLIANRAVYNVPFLCSLRGRLDLSAFEEALDALVERQHALRTVFLSSRGTPVPLVVTRRPVDLKVVDLRHLPENEREPKARRMARQEAAHTFNLTRDPMLRSSLFRLSDEEHMFLFVTHHIVFELGSQGILYRDLSCYYNSLALRQKPQLPELTMKESDFALWQQRTLQGRRLEELSAYWKAQLAGAPTIELPLDFPRPRVHSHRGIRRVFNMPSELVSAGNEFFLKAATTPYRGLLAAFNVFLYSYSGMTDICAGSPFATRCRDVQNTIGFFANTLVLRTDLSDNPTFRQLVRRVDRIVLRAIANADLSFEKIVERVQPPRDPSRTPLFQISFRARTQPYPRLNLHGLVAGPAEFLDNGTAKFDLSLELESANGEACFFEYCSDLFKEQTIAQMEHDYQNLLRELISQPDTGVRDLKGVAEITRRYEARRRVRSQ